LAAAAAKAQMAVIRQLLEAGSRPLRLRAEGVVLVLAAVKDTLLAMVVLVVERLT
jgi:hypothetical protein